MSSAFSGTISGGEWNWFDGERYRGRLFVKLVPEKVELVRQKVELVPRFEKRATPGCITGSLLTDRGWVLRGTVLAFCEAG